MFSKTFTFASLLATSLAFSEVTIRQLPAGCGSYPTYYPFTDSTGRWPLIISDPENPALEGVGVTNRFSVDENNNLRWGYISVNPTIWQARAPFYCYKNTLFTYAEAFNSTIKPDQFSMTPSSLSPDPSDATMRYFTDNKSQLSLFEHYNGTTKLNGYFLGGYNTSTWGVKWQDGDESTKFNPTYYLRLLPKGVGLKPNETKTHIKIDY